MSLITTFILLAEVYKSLLNPLSFPSFNESNIFIFSSSEVITNVGAVLSIVNVRFALKPYSSSALIL